MNKVRLQLMIKNVLNFFGLKLIGINEYRNINFLLETLLEGEGSYGNANTNIIIFSKDRPLQLHALLGSIEDCVTGVGATHILYHASNTTYESGYHRLAVECNLPNVNWYKEEDFRADTLKILDKIRSKLLFFLVDDIIFTEKVNCDDFKHLDTKKYILSLRLGGNLSYCYMADAKQPLPKFSPYPDVKNNEFLLWKWSDGKWDWGYPLSLDGHIFSSNEIKKIFKATFFNSPNSLESAIQIFYYPYKRRMGVCYLKSRLVNIPNNKVQNLNKNRSQGNDPEKLHELWINGFRINYRRYYGLDNKSVHEEHDLA